jgi:xanthine dehydrogenase YagS FAD-binding subunit
MRPFTYVRPEDAAAAIAAGKGEGARFLGGGTTLVDLMRLEVMQPPALVDVARLPMATIEAAADGGLTIGATARNAEVAHHPRVVEGFPVLSEALLSGASPQVRNMATVAGNLLQRTRCPYFRDVATACNKRTPGSGCAALEGYTRSHAILGGSDHCIATHPSDMCVALVALDAVVHTRGGAEERAIPIAQLHLEPGEHPEVETVLAPGELITHVTVPASPFAKRSRYLKVRDRAAFAFALASAAVALELDGDTIRAARVALGGVATRPWRSAEAEQALVGQAATPATFAAAAAAALAGAKPRKDNAFKVELAKRTIVRALELAGGAS